ncbi:exodeoxyribonuclease VII large subunit [Blastococcus sp. Marseille-P5729]|uniref:exodeoxyribonuclease VII large subunit n=1 Tax=Blastococcus sp. Marseille-P5729 TaxID=2086582 RepID=UPI001F19A353|nr:exodeoxyribonuclease VII large subunit [Blastococcus sp. Marseille-P5729]
MPQIARGPENPYPVRVIAMKIAGWIDRLGPIWLEGEIAQLNVRAGTKLAYLTLRDLEAQYSLPITAQVGVVQAVDGGLTEGNRVIVHCKPEFWAQRGAFSMRAREIRQVGLGDLLARIERLRKALEAEGLFAAELKRPLPFLPRRIGLITGRDSAAEKDVLSNARKRWPAVQFSVLNVAVQGQTAAGEVVAALRRMDSDAQIDVIVIARGGGSVEDLLPFSDESLVRAVAQARTPVVSAIGHEPDAPLLDYVADVRASTPTDAAKRVVPDVGEENARIAQGRDRIRAALQRSIDQGYHLIEQLTSRPVLAAPESMILDRRDDIERGRDRIRRATTHRLAIERETLTAARARVTALSPTATLQRGYAVLQRTDGAVVTSTDVSPGSRLSALVTDGRIDLTVEQTHPKET